MLPVDHWQIDSTSQHVAMRRSAEGSSDLAAAVAEHAFLLEPEQARQMIRDLGSAVLALELKRKIEADDAM
jgi:hypothetical protein